MNRDFTAETQAQNETERGSYETMLRYIRSVQGEQPKREDDLTTSKPGGPSEQQRADMARAKAFIHAINSGDLPTFYDQFGGAPPGYWDRLNGPKGHDRGGR